MKIKSFPVTIKAGPEDGLSEGEFTAYASVFGNVDSYGDVVVRGAFTDTLKEWDESGAPIPLYYGHNMSDPDFNLGSATAVEDHHGLLAHATFDLENPKALQTYRLVKGKRVRQMSFAYDVLDSGPTEVDGQKVTELRKLKLYEISVVPVGANQETEILAVKSIALAMADGLKSGRTLSAKHEADLRSARDIIDQVLDQFTTHDEKRRAPAPLIGDPPEGQSIHKDSQSSGAGLSDDNGNVNASVNAEEPLSVNAEEPKCHTSLESADAISKFTFMERINNAYA